MLKECSVPLIEGCVTGLCLIVAIGPQNLMILKQGIQKNHVFITAFGFALCDALLILLGVKGVGAFFASNPLLLVIAKWGGALFLFSYGFLSFRSAMRIQKLEVSSQELKHQSSFKEIIFLVLGLSFLNPHAYLDTVVLLGSISCNFPDIERPYFAVGGILASFVWFFSLAFGARLLSPLFSKPLAWKLLDIVSGCLLWTIGALLLSHSH